MRGLTELSGKRVLHAPWLTYEAASFVLINLGIEDTGRHLLQVSMDGSSVSKVPSELFWIWSPAIQAGVYAPVVAATSDPAASRRKSW